MSLATLVSPPTGVAETLALVDRLDACLGSGFSRLGSDQAEALATARRVLGGTPLAGAFGVAVDAIGRNELGGDSLTAFAIARAGLLGSVHDALTGQATAALGRPQAEPGPIPFLPWTGAPRNLADAVRHWLVEVAIAGFARLEPSALLPFAGTIEKLQEDPSMLRLAALLTGWHAELCAAVPVAEAALVPLRRWADLWTRAMLLTVGAVQTQRQGVEGHLDPVGLEVRRHGHMVSLVGHVLLGGAAVRVSMQAWKVEAIGGAELFELFRPRGDALLAALGGMGGLQVKGTLSAGGELSLTEARPDGTDTDALFARLGAGGVAQVPVPAHDRHPLLIAIPIAGSGPPSASGLPVQGWFDPCSPLNDELCARAERWLGLLRWDGCFFVQPLAVEVKEKKATRWTTNATWAVAPPKTKKKPVIGVLRAKAGKLLRQKA